jgi:hypothetical protein
MTKSPHHICSGNFKLKDYQRNVSQQIVLMFQETTSLVLVFCSVFDAEATYLTNGTSSLTKANGRMPGENSFVSDSSFINTLQVTSPVCKKII